MGRSKYQIHHINNLVSLWCFIPVILKIYGHWSIGPWAFMVNDAGMDTQNFEGWRLMANIKIPRTFSWWLSDIWVNTVISLAYSGQYRRQCQRLRSYMKQIMLAIHAAFVSCHLDPSFKIYGQSKFSFWQLKCYTKFDRNLTVRHVYRLYLWNIMNIWNHKIDPNLLTVNYAAKIPCQL